MPQLLATDIWKIVLSLKFWFKIILDVEKLGIAW
jgi:hypothetical protein